jgi:DNA-binding FrmR family transcriptional regulator
LCQPLGPGAGSTYTDTPVGYKGGPCERAPRMSHTIAKKAKLLNRVARIRGQVEAIERALGTEEGCGAVLQRIAAARGAMNALMSEVLEDHVRTHVLSSKARANVVAADELIEVVRTYLK